MGIDAKRKQELRGKFAKLDKNGDRSLDFGEMCALLKRGNPNMTDRELHLVFDGADKNKDGRLDFDEFVDFIFSQTGEKNEEDHAMKGPERFFYDKSSYTGTHTNGGPSTIDDSHDLRDQTRPNHHPSGAHGGGAHHPSAGGGQRSAAPPAAPCNEGGSLQKVFSSYCAGHADIDGKSFSKLCKDCKLVDKKLTATDVDLIFAKSVTKGQRRMPFENFMSALGHIAEKKGTGVAAVEEAVASATGPILHGTNADAVKFHDDKNLYTGSHAGPGHTSDGRHHDGQHAPPPSQQARAPDMEDALRKVFAAFSAGHPDMDGKSFSKLCKDCKLLDKKLTATDVDLIFAKSVTKGQRRMTFEQFTVALGHVAQKKGTDPNTVDEAVSCSKPVLHGTNPDAVKFHDDKSLYTGTHGDPNDHAPHGKQHDAEQASPSQPHGPDSRLEEAFARYCEGHADMDGKSFSKLCKDTHLLDKKFSSTDADLLFAKVKPKDGRRINYEQFTCGLEEIAKKKGVDFQDVRDRVAQGSGPELHGTKGASRFHDDKSTYTGTHVNGGPEAVAVGAGSAADSSWKRPG